MENFFVYFYSPQKNPSEFLIEQRIESNEQRAKSNEQRAKSSASEYTSSGQK